MIAENELVAAVCPACSSDLPKRVAREGPLRIVRCGKCDLLYVSPRLREPQAHYHGDRDVVLKKYGAILRGEKRHNRDPNYEQELALLGRLRPTGRLLDIGTHCGFFLRKARGMGWELTGVEPSPIGASLAREFYGLDVLNESLESARFPDDSFDLVTLVDVFEHLSKPRELLAEVRRILRDDGLLFIKVPNGRYNLFKYRVINQTLRLGEVEIFDAKEHVAHYTAETLRATLVSAGFEVKLDLVPLPIQDGAVWKCALRSMAYGIARVQHFVGGGFGSLATDVAVVAAKAAPADRLAPASSHAVRPTTLPRIGP